MLNNAQIWLQTLKYHFEYGSPHMGPPTWLIIIFPHYHITMHGSLMLIMSDPPVNQSESRLIM